MAHLRLASDGTQQSSKQSRALRHRLDENVFVRGMSAVSDGA